jgi:hypothetical protein
MAVVGLVLLLIAAFFAARTCQEPSPLRDDSEQYEEPTYVQEEQYEEESTNEKIPGEEEPLPPTGGRVLVASD